MLPKMLCTSTQMALGCLGLRAAVASQGGRSPRSTSMLTLAMMQQTRTMCAGLLANGRGESLVRQKLGHPGTRFPGIMMLGAMSVGLITFGTSTSAEAPSSPAKTGVCPPPTVEEKGLEVKSRIVRELSLEVNASDSSPVMVDHLLTKQCNREEELGKSIPSQEDVLKEPQSDDKTKSALKREKEYRRLVETALKAMEKGEPPDEPPKDLRGLSKSEKRRNRLKRMAARQARRESSLEEIEEDSQQASQATAECSGNGTPPLGGRMQGNGGTRKEVEDNDLLTKKTIAQAGAAVVALGGTLWAVANVYPKVKDYLQLQEIYTMEVVWFSTKAGEIAMLKALLGTPRYEDLLSKVTLKRWLQLRMLGPSKDVAEEDLLWIRELAKVDRAVEDWLKQSS